MRTKRVAAVSVITFMIGGFGGAAYAYVTHSTADGQMALPVNLEQAQENWAVEQFINEQEELHPDGLEQSKIETGSKYTGITYNNVGTATVKQKESNTNTQHNETTNTKVNEETEKGGFLNKLFGKKENNEANHTENENTDLNSKIVEGRIIVKKGSLNVRAKGEMNAKIIGQAYKNDTVQIISQDGDWYQIQTKDGLQGFVSATYVEKLIASD